MDAIEAYIDIALGVLGGWSLAQNWPKLRALVSLPALRPKTPSTQIEGTQTLAMRLHKLDSSYGEFAQAAAHTNELATHPEFKAAVDLLTDSAVPLSGVLDYAFGVNWRLSCAAFAALKARADGSSAARKVADRFNQLSIWQMTFALQFLAVPDTGLPASAPLIGFQDWWTDDARLHAVYVEYFTSLGDSASDDIESAIGSMPAATQERLKTFLGRVRHPLAERIRSHLAGPAKATADPKFLTDLGRFWDKDNKDTVVLEPEDWSDALASVEREFGRAPMRSLLISGEALAGKTSFLRLMARRMAAKGWRVFEAGGADLQAGQIYIGELEGRIRKAIEELAIGRKIIWYVPDLMQLAQSGTHGGQSATILDQLLPAIAAGQILIWSEASPKIATRLLQLRPALRRCLEIVRMEPMPDADVASLAERLSTRLAGDRGLTCQPQLPHLAVDAARHFLGASGLPGSALALLRATVLRTQKVRGEVLTGTDVLETLSQATGLPMAILDGSERLELSAIRDFFATRVIGQPEAVASAVERIAMLKSGLNDPGRPIGVLLFAGPTGTGKTELAKTIAEYLFGSGERMIRLDMSEYQSPDTAAKILGGPSNPRDADTLITRVRKQPFSLLLLDEFEKASPYVWDLFLQVFDEGRLTDGNGDTADFRHCLIILTTNLGATSHRDSGLGFAPARTAFSDDQIVKAVAQTFRPEFQNRLDKIVVFKPLNRELMRGILKKELNRIFERRGLKERAWAVEWEASALEFLLEKGFSPEMGARPLKRAIDQYVIAPMAETIVERRFPEGDQFVFVRRDGDALSAEFVNPDGGANEPPEPQKPDTRQPASEAPTLAAMIRSPTGEQAESVALGLAERAIADRLNSPEWGDLKLRFGGEMNGAEFWSRPGRFATLGKLELMDRLEVAGETAHSMQGRLARNTGETGRGARELVSRLALQVLLLKAGLRDLDEDRPDEAIILIEPVFNSSADDKRAAEHWRDEIAQMYVGWAKLRHMKLEQVNDGPSLKGPVLIVSGFGAFRTMERETGLHILEAGDAASNSGRRTVRVILASLQQANLSKTERVQALAAALAAAPRSSDVVRRYRKTPSALARSADGSWRSGKLAEVLSGNFDLLAHKDI